MDDERCIYFILYFSYQTEIDVKKDFKIVPVKYGGMVLFNNLIPHRRQVTTAGIASLLNMLQEHWSLFTHLC